MISHFLILSKKYIGTVLGSSCLKAGTGKIGLVLILMISDQWTYTCWHHNTAFYAVISHILTLGRFLDFSWLGVASLVIDMVTLPYRGLVPIERIGPRVVLHSITLRQSWKSFVEFARLWFTTKTKSLFESRWQFSPGSQILNYKSVRKPSTKVKIEPETSCTDQLKKGWKE